MVPGCDVGLGWFGNRVQVVHSDCLHAPVEDPGKWFRAMYLVRDDSVDVPCQLSYWVALFSDHRSRRELTLVPRASEVGAACPSGHDDLVDRDLGDLDTLKLRSANLQESFEHLPFR